MKPVDDGRLQMFIHDDRLALMTPRRGPILVLNWKTGRQIAKIPYDYKIYGFTFLDRSSVLFYGTSDIEQILRLQVVTFDSESRNTTDEAALRIYYFDVDALGPKPKPTEFLSSNTLPSNTPGSCFPGLFHSEPSSRLLALEVVIDTDPIWGGGVPRVLYVPHDVFLGHIRSYPSDSHPVVVPWKARGPGNAHILASPHLRPKRVEFAGRKIVCGMHATTEPPMVIGEGNQKIHAKHTPSRGC